MTTAAIPAQQGAPAAAGSADLAAALQSPLAQAAVLALLLLLAATLLREAPRIPKALWALMAAAFLDMVGLLMVVPLLPFYVQRLAGGGPVELLGLSFGAATLAGAVASAFTLAQLLSAPLWGRFSDRRGRRPALLAALAASAVAYLVFGFAESLPLLFVSRLVQGAGGGTVGVIQAYVADTVPPDQRARALGWLSAATNLGVALGPVLGSYALLIRDVDLWPGEGTVALGFAAPGVFAALMCLATLAFAARWLPESNAAARGGPPPVRVPLGLALRRVVREPGDVKSRLILTYAIAIGAFQGVTAVLALFLQARFGVDERSIGYVFLYIGAISVFARVLALGPLVDRLGEARLSRLGITTLATGVLLVPFAHGLPLLVLAIGLLPLGTAFTFPCVTALLSRVVAPADRGLYMGLQQTFGGVARITAPLVYGLAFDHLGIAVPFYLSMLFVLATLPLGRGFPGPAAKAGAAPPKP